MKSELAIPKVAFPLYPGSLGKIVKVISKPNQHYWMIDMDGTIWDCASDYLQIIGSAQQNEEDARVGEQQNCGDGE